MNELEGQIALVTGGGSGIGLAAAAQLASGGAHVVICDRNREALEPALSAVKRCGKAEALALDVSNKLLVASTFDYVRSRHKRIDILVNCAGVNVTKRNLDSMTVDSWDEIVGVNLSGMFYCCHAVVPGMRAQRSGLIINISSWAGRYPSYFTGPAYNASKRAVIALTESINIEECMNGIRATTILPEEVATPLVDKRPNPPSAEARARMLQAEDLARAMYFIATLPPRVCVNELTISPTWNRSYLGGLNPVRAS